MKVYMSVDMEGGTGVTGLKDIMPGQKAYKRFRRLLTQDVNAAVEGAIQGGATGIIVNEAHNGMRNLLLEELHPKAELITGFNKPLLMVDGINSTFNAAFMIGYHARAGTAASVVNHTLFLEVLNVRVNGELLGEFGLSTMVAGHFGVPVVLVTGDDKVIKEAVELVGNIESACVKKGIDLTVAQCLPPEESTTRIRDAAKRAVTNVTEYKPLKLTPPLKFEVEFAWTSMAAAATLITGVTRENSRTVTFTSQNAVEGYQMLTAALLTSSSASPLAEIRSLSWYFNPITH